MTITIMIQPKNTDTRISKTIFYTTFFILLEFVVVVKIL